MPAQEKQQSLNFCYCNVQNKDINLHDITKIVATLNLKILRLRNDIVALKTMNTENEKSLKTGENTSAELSSRNPTKQVGIDRNSVKSKETINAGELITREVLIRSVSEEVEQETNKETLKEVSEVNDKSQVQESTDLSSIKVRSNSRCQNTEKNDTYCYCISQNVGTTKVRKKKVSRGVQYDAVPIRKRKRNILSCFKMQLGKKHKSPRKMKEIKSFADNKQTAVISNSEEEKLAEVKNKGSSNMVALESKEEKMEHESHAKDVTHENSMKYLKSQDIMSEEKENKNKKLNGILKPSKNTIFNKIIKNEDVRQNKPDETKQKTKSVRINSENRHLSKNLRDKLINNASIESETNFQNEIEQSQIDKNSETDKTDGEAGMSENPVNSPINRATKRAKQYKNMKSNANNVKKRLDACIVELNGIIGDVSSIFPNKNVPKDHKI